MPRTSPTRPASRQPSSSCQGAFGRLARVTMAGNRAMRGSLIAQSESMRRVLRLAGVYASSEFPVLLTGETGTGKTLLAQWIHKNSPRADKTFEVRNCAAFSETLALSELFGHERGAFTGADRSRVGAFRKAHGGTLFLDEVSRMFPVVQGAILKAIDEGTIQPVGSDRAEQVDVRLIAATNQDLWALAEQGRFAFDLFQRLAVLTISLPPLRDRQDDLLPLAQGFLYAEAPRGKICRLADEALTALCAHHFPGNVRELEAVMEECRLIAAAEVGEAVGELIISADVVSNVLSRRSHRQAGSPQTISDMQKQFRQEALKKALDRHGGKITAVAADLGVSRQTVSKWMRQMGLAAEGK